jgi:sn-glycerol 3-phosphate transport system substrate-binding protein
MTAIRTGNISQLQAAFSGQKSVDNALDDAAAAAKKALADYKSQLGE